MERLGKRHGEPTVARALRYACIRFASRPESAPFAAEGQKHRRQVSGALDTWEEARETRVAASAELAYADVCVDRLTMSLSRDVIAMVDGDRTDPRFYKLFPTAPSDGTEPVAGDEQHGFVWNVIKRLRSEPEYASVKEHAAPLRTAQDRLEELETARKELYATEGRARVDLELALDDAKRWYNRMHPRLLLLFDDEALVESFFSALRGEDE